MAYWIFKIAKQKLYRDDPGKLYVYDNTHSRRVAEGDVFLYLDKTMKYSFTATGIVHKLIDRAPSRKESQRTEKVRTIFEAHLQDVIWFTEPLTISSSTKQGKKNRARLEIENVNLLGWSRSVPSLSEPLYDAILDLAEPEKILPLPPRDGDFSIPDNWGETKTRSAIKKFSGPVMARSNRTCIVCGTSLRGLVEAAHLSPYADDKKNRANPANGICLCKYCHCALDSRLIGIQPNGVLLVSPLADDDLVACHHFSRIAPEQRLRWLKGVNHEFLELTVRSFRKGDAGP